MQYTMNKCDKCGKEWLAKSPGQGPEDEQAVAIGVSVQFGKTKFEQNAIFSGMPVTVSAMWCRQCVMRAGVVEPKSDADKKVAPSKMPSFEDLFVELLDSLGYTRE